MAIWLWMKTLPVILLCSFAVVFKQSAVAQGSLTPPGAPAPNMRTLDQVQPRTPIDATNTPGDASNRFIINASGTYYFTGNISGVSGKHGISVQADNVTIDLNGFVLGLTGSTTTNGIDIPNAQTNIAIRHGIIRNWKNGINAPAASNCSFENLTVSNSVNAGLNLYQGSLVKGCVVTNNGTDGIVVHDNSQVIDCLSRGNTGGGIVGTGNGFTVGRCTVTSNQGAGISLGNGGCVNDCAVQFNHAGGIVGGAGTSVTGCAVDQNSGVGIIAAEGSAIANCGITRSSTDGINTSALSVVIANCNVAGNFNNGIVLGIGSRVIACTVGGNGATGVQLSNQSSIHSSTVVENFGEGVSLSSADDCVGNNVSNNGGGIHASSANGGGFGNRIDGNQVRDNSNPGILVDVANAHNLVVRNSAGNNTGSNYSIAAGNKVGPIVNDPSGSTANAWANFVDP